jgi:assimilatory nitrate reductase catalytic subunit
MPRFRGLKITASGRSISGLADLSREAWDNLAPVRWPVSRSGSGLDLQQGWHGDGKLRMVPVTPQATRATTDAFSADPQ